MIDESTNKIEKNLSSILIKCDLDKFINVETIKKWISNIELNSDSKVNRFPHLTMLSGLLDKQFLNNPEFVQDLFNSVIELYKIAPIKEIMDNQVKTKSGYNHNNNTLPTYYLETLDFPRLSWVSHYHEAMDCLRNKDIKTASMKFDEVFTTLLKDETTYREIYRIFCNAGLAHLFAGNTLLGLRCIEIAKELNPKYYFADKQLKNFQNDESNNLIKIAHLAKINEMISEYKESYLEKEYLDFNKVCNWPETRILNKLLEFGVKVDRSKFTEIAKKVHRSDEIAKILFSPQCDTSRMTAKWDEDFLWMAAAALWNIYCPDEPEVENLNNLLENAIEFLSRYSILESPLNEKTIYKFGFYLKKIQKFVYSNKNGFLEYWSKTYEYNTGSKDNMIYFLKNIVLIPALEKQVLDLTEYLQTQIPNSPWELVKITLFVYKNDKKWEGLYQNLKEKYPYDCYIAYDVSNILEKIGNIKKSEQILLEALQIVDSRRDNKIWDLATIYTTIYEDYKFILSKLKEFYEQSYPNIPKLENIKNKLKKIEENSKIYSNSERIKKLKDVYIEVQEIEMNKNPAIQYYNFLKQFEINFTTKYEVNPDRISLINFKPEDILEKSENKSTYRIRTTHKISRNDPCFCGSGKKYKKCCMRKVHIMV